MKNNLYKFIILKTKTIVFISAILLSSLTFSCQTPEEVKREQYMVEGRLAYEQHCANCHQSDGKGLANLYPPIANSDFLKDKEAVICVIKNGISGEILVNNKKYNQAMPGNIQLQDLDIALITTYIYNTWQTEKTITTAKSINTALKKCK